MTNYSAYLSHARVDGGLSVSARALESYFESRGDELIHDTDAVRMNRSVGGFVKRLTTSPVVVYLLNERFFESLWCVHELTEVIDRKDKPENHFVLIRTEDWLKKEKGMDAYIRTELAEKQVEHWHKFQEKSKDKKHRALANNNAKLIEQALECISECELPCEDLTIQTKVPTIGCKRKIHSQVVRLNKRYRLTAVINTEPLKKYHKACAEQLARYLRSFPDFVEDLAVVTDNEGTDHRGIAKFLILEKNVVERLDYCRDALTDYCQRIDGKSRDIKKVSQFIGLMLLSAVDIDEKLVKGIADIDLLEIEETDEYAASLFVSRLQNKPGSGLTHDGSKFSSRGAYEAGRKESDVVDLIDSQIHNLWDYENMGAIPKDEDKLLSRLNERMRDNFVSGISRYLIIEKGSALDNAKLLSELKTRLPLLFIFRVGAGAKSINILSADLGARTIGDILQQFERILNEK